MSNFIPPELIPNILARLPVEDVLRCTSVCKSWYSLITSPSFAYSHLILCSPNQEPRLLVKYVTNGTFRVGYRLHHDSQTFDEIEEIYPPFYRHWETIDSFNGLVCLYDTMEKVIVLWNPSSRKSLILPKPRVFSSSQGGTVGFCFIPSSNEYKVVWFSYSYDQNESQAQIYQRSTGSWRGLELEDFSYTCLYSQQHHYNGILHWSASHLESDKTLSYFMHSFDTKDEKFGALMVPNGCKRFKVSTFRESLCLIDVTSFRFCNIWGMKEYGVADSWEKLFIIDTKQHGLRGNPFFGHNDELLFAKDDNENGTSNTKLVLYNCNNNQVRNLGAAIGPVSSIHTYVDSLVLIKAPNDAMIEQESTEISKRI